MAGPPVGPHEADALRQLFDGIAVGDHAGVAAARNCRPDNRRRYPGPRADLVHQGPPQLGSIAPKELAVAEAVADLLTPVGTPAHTMTMQHDRLRDVRERAADFA